MGTKDTQIIARLCMGGLAPYPGLSVPVFVACSSNTEENLSLTVTYLDVVWMCGGVAHSICTVVDWHSDPQEMSPRLPDVNRSAALWSVVAISSALTCDLSENVSLLHTSTQCPVYPSSLSKELTNQMTLL